MLKRSAQYKPPVDYAALEVFSEEEKKKAEEDAEKAGGKSKNPRAQRGFVHVPATEGHGGVLVHGGIRRDVTINLIALRRLHGEKGPALRSYVLGLTLSAVTRAVGRFPAPGLSAHAGSGCAGDLGCRGGAMAQREQLVLDEGNALAFAQQAAAEFGVSPDRTVTFDKSLAKSDAKRG